MDNISRSTRFCVEHHARFIMTYAHLHISKIANQWNRNSHTFDFLGDECES